MKKMYSYELIDIESQEDLLEKKVQLQENEIIYD